MTLTRLSAIRCLCALLWLGGCQSSNRQQAEPIGAVPPAAIGAAGTAAIVPAPPAGPAVTAGAPAAPVPDPAQGAAGATGGAGGAAAVPEPEILRPAGGQDASHARGATPDYDSLFADDRVHRIDLEMTAESHQAMQDDLEMLLGAIDMGDSGGMPGRDPTDLVGGDPIYVPVTMRYDGGVWTHVGMRLKGNSSLASAYRTGVLKLGFRLDFDRYEGEQPETTDQRFYAPPCRRGTGWKRRARARARSRARMASLRLQASSCWWSFSWQPSELASNSATSCRQGRWS